MENILFNNKFANLNSIKNRNIYLINSNILRTKVEKIEKYYSIPSYPSMKKQILFDLLYYFHSVSKYNQAICK